MLKGRDIRAGELEARRQLLIEKVLPLLGEPIRLSPALDGDLPDLIEAVKQQKLEGLVGKRKDSVYKSGERSDLWLKMRINSGQEFVIGGYTLGGTTFDAVVFGYYEEGSLHVRGSHAQRIHASYPAKLSGEVPRSGDGQVPFRELAGKAWWPLGPGSHCGEDERLCLAEAETRGTVRICGMDAR